MSRICLALAMAFSGWASTSAFAEPAPRSLDQALSTTLSLGVAAGCFSGFGITDSNGDNNIDDSDLGFLRNNHQLGNELAAICGSSAVASAAALGGSMGSLQATKTVSQFRLVRRRVDSRLGLRGERFGLGGSFKLAELGESWRETLTDASRDEPTPSGGFSVFGQGEFERRNRDTTMLEAGYRADVSGGLIGFDYLTPSGILAGAWAGYGNTSADYRGINLLIGGATGDPSLISNLCNIGAGGGFDIKGGKFGGFVGTRFGNGFADLAVQYGKRDYDYRRNVCAIEAISAAGSPLVVGDDIYAGTISGQTKLTEWSVSARTGYDFGNDRLLWGPRLSITYLKSKIDGFIESGVTSVTNTVTSANNLLVTPRAAGDPTGLELAYDKQERSSLQTEVQFVAAYRFDTAFGALIPRASASWIHEYKGERELVTVRMAQDFRATPTRFSFTTDAADKDKGVIAVGVTAVIGRQLVADLELAHLVADSKFDSTTVMARARWSF